jgi:nucleoside-diphosphate-sugar epimerase
MIAGLSRVLVTGGTGFIGFALTQRLSAEGTHVVCPIRKGSGQKSRLAGLPYVTIVETDFSAKELDTLLHAHSPEVIFHLAAAGIRPDDRRPDTVVAGNVGLTTTLVGACEHHRLRRFVFAGSCSEYAPIAEGSLIREDHPLLPTSLYGAAKASAYLCGRALSMSLTVPFVALRFFGVFGPGEGPERLIPHLYAHFSSGKTPELTPGGQARDLTYIDDIVDALLLGATHDQIEVYGAYNVCSGRPFYVRDIASLVARETGQTNADIGLGRRPYRTDESLWIVGDPLHFSEATGYIPRFSVEEGISRMIANLRHAGVA